MSGITILYNPTASQGKAAERLPELETALNRAGIAYSIVLTTGPGSAIEQTEALIDAAESSAIVAAGGDGTVNEVLNGFMRRRTAGSTLPDFGVIPVGRGNDFTYGMGVPETLEGAVDTLAAGTRKKIDVGYISGGRYPEGRYFGNGIGIGFDTVVGFEAAKLRHLQGFSAYLVGALKTMLFYYNTPLLKLTIDGETFTANVLQMSIMNGRRMGGGFYMAPHAEPDDGALDICMARTPRRIAMLGVIVQYLKGTQESNRHISTYRCRNLRVEPQGESIAVHADGETISTDGSVLEIGVEAQAISILSPDS